METEAGDLRAPDKPAFKSYFSKANYPIVAVMRIALPKLLVVH